MTRRPMTYQGLRRILAAIASGQRTDIACQTADIHPRTPSIVRRACFRYKIGHEWVAALEAGKQVQARERADRHARIVAASQEVGVNAAAAEFGVSRSTVVNLRHKLGRGRPPISAVAADAYALWQQGKSFAEVGKAIGCGRQLARSYVHNYALHIAQHARKAS